MTIDALLEAAKTAPPRIAERTERIANARPEPYMTIEDGECHVFNSYDVREKLRGMGFRWDKDRVTWSKSVVEVMSDMGCGEESEVTLESVLKFADSAPQARVEQGPADAIIELQGSEVRGVGSLVVCGLIA